MKESYAIRVYKEYFNFASSHFLIFADGTREPLHGHNYQVQVRVEGGIVEGDLVIDFIPFKPLVRQLCDEMDHCLLLPDSNPHLRIETGDTAVSVWHRDGGYFQFSEGGRANPPGAKYIDGDACTTHWTQARRGNS